jgi:hypothetical protein
MSGNEIVHGEVEPTQHGEEQASSAESAPVAPAAKPVPSAFDALFAAIETAEEVAPASPTSQQAISDDSEGGTTASKGGARSDGTSLPPVPDLPHRIGTHPWSVGHVSDAVHLCYHLGLAEVVTSPEHKKTHILLSDIGEVCGRPAPASGS